MRTQLADSSYQAKAILGAWRTGDKDRLRTELERVTVVKYKGFDSGEVERMELLGEIARELRSSSEALSGDSSRVYCSLLEHLAYSGQRATAGYSTLGTRTGGTGNCSTVKALLLLQSITCPLNFGTPFTRQSIR